jgi:hypothetical protein
MFKSMRLTNRDLELDIIAKMIEKCLPHGKNSNSYFYLISLVHLHDYDIFNADASPETS